METERDLKTLLLEWSSLAPEECRKTARGFELRLAETEWLSVTDLSRLSVYMVNLAIERRCIDRQWGFAAQHSSRGGWEISIRSRKIGETRGRGSDRSIAFLATYLNALGVSAPVVYR